ncbi:MAG: FAD-dependent oxidoreductase [Geminicoccaceae bacterium]|nr:FAD-dependent oxidoreductase [Geminicoccaceae bacterium]MDW8371097.1 FAD-dependent oxidoreductase [Geminicoccaceae bacterium]
MTRYVIVGAGEAGTRAAAALRDAGEGEVLLLSEEPVPPYERPPLSKPDDEHGFRKPVAVDLAGIELRLSTRVVAVDRAEGRLETEAGERIAYDRLLLATGARPRRLAVAGASRALVLRTLADAEAIDARVRAGARATIVGAGLIGLELACTLRRRGLEVAVVELAPRALGRAVPAELAERLVARHERQGVRFLFGTEIAAIEPAGVRLADGNLLAAEIVVAAIGVEPETALAATAGLPCANGILVDSTLRTADPSIWAAGDCAAIDHPRYGRVRFENWRMACDQGAFAGRVMRGEGGTFAALPWFWSDQWDLSLQIVGLCDPARCAVHRSLGADGLVRFELDGTGRLEAAAALGPAALIGREIRLAERLIERAVACPSDLLADPGADLRRLLRG